MVCGDGTTQTRRNITSMSKAKKGKRTWIAEFIFAAHGLSFYFFLFPPVARPIERLALLFDAVLSFRKNTLISTSCPVYSRWRQPIRCQLVDFCAPC